MTPTLLYLPYSPWSECARWALDARRVDYKKQRYQPLLGEPGLRRKLKRWRGAVSVPVLLVEPQPIADSLEIARWAETHGSGPSLFPADDGPVLHWVARSQEAMAAGRALSLTRVVANDDAVDELTPPRLRMFGAVTRAITRAGVNRTRRKYGGGGSTEPEHQATLEAVLDEMRVTLKDRETLLGAFSFADIRAAQALCFVRPHDGPYVRIGDANRTAFGDPELASRYADLLAWRDALYAKYRGAPS